MRVAEMSPTYIRCRRSWLPIRLIGLWMLCTSAMLWVTHTESIWIRLAVAAAGLGLAFYDEEQSVVIDRAAGTVRITNRDMVYGTQVVTLRITDITDVAVEQAPISGTRGVFVCRDGRRAPWERWSRLTMYQRAAIAVSVAAARRVGGWSTLPIQEFGGVRVPVIQTTRAEATSEMRAERVRSAR